MGDGQRATAEGPPAGRRRDEGRCGERSDGPGSCSVGARIHPRPPLPPFRHVLRCAVLLCADHYREWAADERCRGINYIDPSGGGGDGGEGGGGGYSKPVLQAQMAQARAAGATLIVVFVHWWVRWGGRVGGWEARKLPACACLTTSVSLLICALSPPAPLQGPQLGVAARAGAAAPGPRLCRLRRRHCVRTQVLRSLHSSRVPCFRFSCCWRLQRMQRSKLPFLLSNGVQRTPHPGHLDLQAAAHHHGRRRLHRRLRRRRSIPQ